MKAVHIYFGAILAIFLLVFSSCDKIDDIIDDDDDIQEVVEDFRIIKTVFTQLEEMEEIITVSEEFLVRNTTKEAFWYETDFIFENAIELSHFKSDDSGAFSWMNDKEFFVQVPDLILDNGMGVLTPYTQTYIEGLIERRAWAGKRSSSILLESGVILYLRGEITSYKRVYQYTLTLESLSTGRRNEVSGIWTHIFPHVAATFISDKPKNSIP
jgi:hypothetical protein